jgi:galactokinase
VHDISAAFREAFDGEPELIVEAPGRVNIIGEHTDYNDGYVFPAAIDRRISIAARPGSDRRVRALSMDFNQAVAFDLDDIGPDPAAPWSNYLRGVAVEFAKRGHRLRGAELVVRGDVPIGAGLSSSAAIEVCFAETMRILSETPIAPVDLALLCQAAERNFVGVQCGIMDQFVVTLAKPDAALFIDCRHLTHEAVPLIFESVDARIVICDSRVQRKLDASAYNQRRSECEEAVRLLASRIQKIDALRDVTVAQLEGCKEAFPDVIYRRARHVVSENERVLTGMGLLKEGQLHSFGELMYLSHGSLKDDYEVSCRELDILVELARRQPGTIGARMTGAGFGGCTVNLVKAGAVGAFSEEVAAGYLAETGMSPRIWVCTPSAGVRSKL